MEGGGDNGEGGCDRGIGGMEGSGFKGHGDDGPEAEAAAAGKLEATASAAAVRGSSGRHAWSITSPT
jgi:hypothetical protein